MLVVVFTGFYHATRMHRADCVVARCPSVCPSIHHMPVFYRHCWMYPQHFFTTR